MNTNRNNFQSNITVTKTSINNKNLKYNTNCEIPLITEKVSKKNENQFDKLKILSINIRSMKKHFNELLILVSETNPDLIAVIETFLNENEVNMFKIKNYKQFNFCRPAHLTGGGITTYIREEFNTIEYPIKCITDSIEYICLKIDTTHLQFNFLACYRLHKSTNRFLEQFSDIIENNIKPNKSIIVGDININLLEKNNYSNKYLNILINNGYEQCIFGATREHFKGEKLNVTCLDHCFIKNMKKIDSEIIKTKISDHYPIQVVIKSNNKIKLKTNVTNSKRYKETQLKNLIDGENWYEITNKNNLVNEKYNLFVEKMQHFYSISAQEPCTKRIYKETEWITNNIKKEITKRDELFKKWKKSQQNVHLRKEYNLQRNKVTKLINNSKIKHINKEIEKNKHDVKKTWKKINEITGRKEISSIDYSINKYIQNPSNSNNPNYINNKFLETFINEIDKLITECNTDITIINRQQHLTTNFKFKKIDLQDLRKIIRKMDNNKAPGIDLIRVKDLKNNEQLIELLCNIVNNSLETATIPNLMKISVIRPIYKAGKHCDMTNYRPICILNSTEKILETVIHTQLTTYLVSNKIITNQQYGFQKNKSSESCLEQFTQYINSQLHLNKQIFVLYIDFTKAFDILSHKIILNSLRQIGIKGNELNWFTDYLKNRQATVRLNETTGDCKNWKYGIPQGSKIGPILYILATNQLPDMINDGKVYMFADDIAIVTTSDSAEISSQKMNNIVRQVQKISHDLGLVINIKKTKVMHIRNRGPKYSLRKFTYHSHDCLHKTYYSNCTCDNYIDMTEEHKYLGLIIDSRLTWQPQINEIYKKMRAASSMIQKLKYNLPQKTLKIVYYSLVESVINYGIETWHATKNEYTNNLQIIQNRIIKLMLSNKFNKKFKNTNDKFKHLNILTIEKLYKFKIIKNNYFKYMQKERNREERYKLRIKRDNIPIMFNKYGDRLNEMVIPKIFNEIPMNLKALTKIGDVKKQFKKWLIDL